MKTKTPFVSEIQTDLSVAVRGTHIQVDFKRIDSLAEFKDRLGNLGCTQLRDLLTFLTQQEKGPE